MKYIVYKFLFVIFCFGLGSCATIIGGTKYNAMVKVAGHKDAEISYKGSNVGKGYAYISVPRKDANKLSFEVSKKGCPTQEFSYNVRKFRGWALAGSVYMSVFSVVGGVPIPIPVAVDLGTGSVYKPDASHPFIFKSDYKNYNYSLDFQCDIEEKKEDIPIQQAPVQRIELSKEEKLIELKGLYEKGMISEEEHKEARLRIISR